MRLLSLVPLSCILAAPPALARASDVPLDLDRDSVTVGIGGVYMSDYEGADHYGLYPLPAAIGSIGGYNFSVLGNRASVDLIRNKSGQTWDFQAGPLGVLNLNRDSRGDIHDPQARALPKVPIALELGGFVGIGKTGVVTSPYDRISLSISYRHDVTGVHDSAVVSPALTYMTPFSRKTAAMLFVSAEHAGRGYMQRYFGIGPAGSMASGLPVYSARGGWKSWTAGLAGTVSISGDLLHGWKLVGGGSYSRELGDAADSPLVRDVGSANQWIGALGVAYTF